MFPHTHDALPLPPHPNLGQYRKLAKELSHAAKSAQAEAIHDWIRGWLSKLAVSANSPGLVGDLDPLVAQFAKFSRLKLLGSPLDLEDPGAAKAALTHAQFVLARSHGFASWAKFAEHLDRLSHADSVVAQFEAAADAIVGGDSPTLYRLLSANPALVRARSSREHRATLLHYVAANGVENFRQRTPANVVAIAESLLYAGASVNAEAEVYGARATTLGLAATSGHPEHAGVQISLLEKLLEYGASLAPELQNETNRDTSLVNACLGNGRLQAAEFLAVRGAPVDLESAAGLGWLDHVKSCFDMGGRLRSKASITQLQRGFFWACEYGRTEVVRYLLKRGADLSAADKNGQTALHWAIIGGKVEIVRILLERKAPIKARNVFGGTALGQAQWSAQNGGDPQTYAAIANLLIASGAKHSSEGG